MAGEIYNNFELSGIQYRHSYTNYHRPNPDGDNDIRTHARKGAKGNLHNHSTKERINHRKERGLKKKFKDNLLEEGFGI